MRPMFRAALLAPALFFAPVILAQDTETKPKETPKETKATEKPLLWVIEGETPSYMFGTVHVPDERVTTLPAVVTEAIDGCDALYCELPMDMKSQMSVQGKMMLPKGKTLKEIIGEDLFNRTDAVMKQKGLPGLMPPLTQMQPWALAAQIPMLDYMPALMAGKQPLDVVLYNRAQKAGKEVGGLETYEEQLGALSGIDGVEMLKNTIEGIEKADKEGKRPMDELLELYLAGDVAALEAHAMKEMENAPAEMKEKFQKMMLTDRNNRMVERMTAKLKENPGKSYFFAVGALHMAGKDGFITLMEGAGYKVRQLTAADAGTLKKKEPAGAGAPR